MAYKQLLIAVLETIGILFLYRLRHRRPRAKNGERAKVIELYPKPSYEQPRPRKRQRLH